jgi:hypothetical protein
VQVRGGRCVPRLVGGVLSFGARSCTPRQDWPSPGARVSRPPIRAARPRNPGVPVSRTLDRRHLRCTHRRRLRGANLDSRQRSVEPQPAASIACGRDVRVPYSTGFQLASPSVAGRLSRSATPRPGEPPACSRHDGPRTYSPPPGPPTFAMYPSPSALLDCERPARSGLARPRQTEHVHAQAVYSRPHAPTPERRFRPTPASAGSFCLSRQRWRTGGATETRLYGAAPPRARADPLPQTGLATQTRVPARAPTAPSRSPETPGPRAWCGGW